MAESDLHGQAVEALSIDGLRRAELHPARSGEGFELRLVYLSYELNSLRGSTLHFADAAEARSWFSTRFPGGLLNGSLGTAAL